MADLEKDEIKNESPASLTETSPSAQAPAPAGGVLNLVPPFMRKRFSHRPRKPGQIRIAKANPELKHALHNIQISEDRIEHDLARLEGDKQALVDQIKNLEDQRNFAENQGATKATITRIQTLLTEAQDRLKMISGIIPEHSVSRDRVLMEEILKKWREYDHERTHQAVAEHKLNVNPEDKKAEGDFNRARAAAHALNEEIATLVKQGEQRVENDTPNPVRDESISYTRAQMEADEELRAQHTVQKQTPAWASSLITPEPTPAITPEVPKVTEPVVAENPELIETIPETKEAGAIQNENAPTDVDLDPVIWEDVHPSTENNDQHTPIQAPETEATSIETVPKKQETAKAIEEITPTFATAPSENESGAQVVLQDLAPAPEEMLLFTPKQTLLDDSLAQEITPEKPTPIIAKPVPAVVPEIAPETKQELPETTTSPLPEIAPDIVNTTPEQPPTIQPEPAPQTQVDESPQIEEAPKEESKVADQLMPQEIAPRNPQVIAYADAQVKEHLDSLFGKKGIFGIGYVSGEDSPHWKDSLFGFAGKTVAQVMEAEPKKETTPGAKHYGIENFDATEKIQDYLVLAMSETGVHPEPEESTDDYLRRASAVTIDKYLQQNKKLP